MKTVTVINIRPIGMRNCKMYRPTPSSFLLPGSFIVRPSGKLSAGRLAKAETARHGSRSGFSRGMEFDPGHSRSCQKHERLSLPTAALQGEACEQIPFLAGTRAQHFAVQRFIGLTAVV